MRPRALGTGHPGREAASNISFLQARVLACLGSALAAALFATGCTTTEPRPVYRATTVTGAGPHTLVVGVDGEGANRHVVDGLARQLAFALSQRGRIATDLTPFCDAIAALGRPLPDVLRDRLLTGVLDPSLVTAMRGEGVHTVIFVEVEIYDQVWGTGGKRTRVGLTARAHDFVHGESTWRVYAAPDADDEPGRGFQLATNAALGALVRAISREPEPAAVPTAIMPVLDKLKWW
jgi:hypothetical protein